jgi:hypothetical protein
MHLGHGPQNPGAIRLWQRVEQVPPGSQPLQKRGHLTHLVFE